MIEDNGKSLIVSGSDLRADARWIEICIFTVFALIIIWSASSLVCMAIDAIVHNTSKIKLLRSELQKRKLLIPRQKKRHDHLKHTISSRNDGLQTVQSERIKLVARLNKIKHTSDHFIREIGEANGANKCYDFIVSNRYVLQYVSKGQQHPLLDGSWSSGQLVNVWAASLLDARVMIAGRYPVSFGYVIEKLKVKRKAGESGDNTEL